MASLHRKCSECSAELSHPSALTCSPSCRGKRSRRLARSKKRAPKQQTAGVAEFAGLEKVQDVAREVMQEELAPIIREAITEEVLRGIQKLVALTPKMVDALGTDLEDDDPAVRQKAYTLGMRYTLGHGAIVQPDVVKPQGGVTVVFEGMPRPDFTEDVPSEAEEVEPDRTCTDCQRELHPDSFVAHSDRCLECFEALTAKAKAILDD